MPVTQKQIAERLGISQQVVGYTLLGRKKVGEPMRRRILAMAHEMGYVPNAAAQMLRSGTTRNIVLAYVNPNVYTSANIHVTHALAEGIGAHGYKLELKCAPDNDAVLELLHDIVRSQGADGFVLWGEERHVARQGALLESLGRPFIARGYYEDAHPDWIQVNFDHRGMMRRTLDKLIELGHERIGYLGHDIDEPYAVHFRRTFDSIVAESFHRATPPQWVLLSQETLESGRRIVNQIMEWAKLPAERRPTALACGGGGSIITGVDTALLSQGIRIGDLPGQFAIAGAGGYPDVRLITGPSWVYRNDCESEMIREMIDLQLMPLIRGEKPRQRILRYLPELHRFCPEPDIWSTGALQVNANWMEER